MTGATSGYTVELEFKGDESIPVSFDMLYIFDMSYTKTITEEEEEPNTQEET